MQWVKKMDEVKRIIELYRLYGSIRRVAQEMGISRNTVKKYVNRVQAVKEGEAEEIIPTQRKIERPCTAAVPEVKDKIHEILANNKELPKKQRWKGKRIWQHVVGLGYPISYCTVKRVISEWKEHHTHRDVYILQEPEQGFRAEFDWGRVDLNIDGRWSKYPMATMVLNNSLYRFSRIYLRETLQEVIDAHIHFFQEVGGVPKTIFYDNMRTVIDPSTGEWNSQFLAFALHYGFEPSVCNKQSPHEKGTDEESIGYIRRTAFCAQTTFHTLDAANQHLKDTLSEINNQAVYRRKYTPKDGLEKERASLQSLPTLEYSNYLTRVAQISKYSIIQFESNYYSIPDDYPGRTITLKIFPGTLEMIQEDKIIATHIRRFGREGYSLDISHYFRTLQKKPGALARAKVFLQLHESIQQVFNRYYRNNPRDFLLILSLIKETSAECLVFAIQKLEEHQMMPTYETLRCIIYCQPYQMVKPFSLSSDVVVDEPNLSVYDQMMRV